MKTDELILALAADTTTETPPAGRLIRTLPVAVLVPMVAVALFWQVRVDLAQALTSIAVYKTLVPSMLSLAALWLGFRLTRPEARARLQAVVLGAVLTALALTLAYGLATSSRADIAMQMDKPDFINCLISVPFLSMLPLAAMLYAMRSGAPRSPARAGALAGLVAGGIGAAAYSLHCPHDALMYFFAGYGSAIAGVTAVGTLIGWKLLRW